jgi:hypothetical protein
MYYSNIDEMPLWNWRKCVEGLLEYCRLNQKKGKGNTDLENWTRLYDQYLARFGLAKDHELVIEKKLQLADLQLEYCENGIDFSLNKIRRLEREIEDILNRTKTGATIEECLMVLSKWMGFRLDQKVTTIMEFQTYLESYEKEAKAQRQNNPNG